MYSLLQNIVETMSQPEKTKGTINLSPFKGLTSSSFLPCFIIGNSKMVEKRKIRNTTEK